MRCDQCLFMRPGSSFDGKHLYCLWEHCWTNLMAYMGADQTEIDSVMEEVRCGNVQRGRYE